MGIRSSKSLHPDKSKQVESKKKTQVSESNILSNDTSDGQSVVIPNTQFHLYGQHETQVSEGGEADLHKHMDDCKKNPGHTKFIPVKTLTQRNLPKGYHDHVLYELIKATADVTVRVEVKMTSPNRPEFYPDTNVPYPFHDKRNKRTLRLGTGEIGVWKFTDARGVNAAAGESKLNGEKYSSLFDASTRTCPCTKCQHSDKPSSVWWKVIIFTAAHVVFDDIEASHTICRLFYDGRDSDTVNLDKVSVDEVNIEEDMCVLKYVTCDPKGDKLYNMEVHRAKLSWKVFEKYKNKSGIKLTFIVSHPHGCYKQVSVGQLMDNYKVGTFDTNLDMTKLTYTTSTCPGSSGATVYCVESSNGHRHSGALVSGLNYSGIGYYWK